MQISRLYLLLKIFVLFIILLIVEYVCSGIYFRLVRHSDFLIADLICGISATGLCYLIFRKLIRGALQDKIPVLLVGVLFLFFCFLLGCFLRFSLQLANGLLDTSEPQTRVVVVESKEISALGGSFKEGPNPMAHLIYFRDWDNRNGNCELLVPAYFYYTVGPGTRVELSLHQGFFHWAWVEDFQMGDSPLDRYQSPPSGPS
jgi:hypothetical protein